MGQHWDREADVLFKNDVERAQALFLAAPSVSRRVNKLKVQTNKIFLKDWDIYFQVIVWIVKI